MARRKFSPSEVLARLRAIDALVADGTQIAEALRMAGVLPAEYEKWRSEYAGLLRTLGPLAAPPRNDRRAKPGRFVRTVKP